MAGDSLRAGESLFPGDLIDSASGQYRLIMQTDGNLVVYDRWAQNQPIWSSDTAGAVQTEALMQSDGNFVIYTAGDQAIWSTGTYGSPNAYLIMQDDGNLVVYSVAPVWASR